MTYCPKRGPFAEHVYGTGRDCLFCGQRAKKPHPAPPRYSEVDEVARQRPGTVRDPWDCAYHPVDLYDWAGWGEDGSPWG